jgi:hypothetical protein
MKGFAVSDNLSAILDRDFDLPFGISPFSLGEEAYIPGG